MDAILTYLTQYFIRIKKKLISKYYNHIYELQFFLYIYMYIPKRNSQ